MNVRSLTLKLVITLVSASSLTACSNQKSSKTAAGAPPAPEVTCRPNIPKDADLRTIASAFHEYQKRCNPTEEELAREIAQLD